MTTVHIDASKSYDVLISRGCLAHIGEEAAKLISPCKAVIVSGEKVFPLYGEALKKSLENAGFEVLTFIHESGESAKSLEVFGALQSFLCKNHISRTDALFALGGGVTGDLTGFAAATYQRGIAWFQIPTTLLAAVDSSVGGKTAINLPEGKNQVGCFYQPNAVFCDTQVLKTLSPEVYRSGVAEIIKYAVLGDAEFFEFLEKNDVRENDEKVIAHCVKMKRDIVNADEFDRGVRKLLNLGHTVGHAVEKCSDFSVSHGDAVAIGLAAVMRGNEDEARVISLLNKYNLPTKCPFDAEEISAAVKADKKIEHGKLNLIVPEKIGSCKIVPIEPEDIKNLINHE